MDGSQWVSSPVSAYRGHDFGIQSGRLDSRLNSMKLQGAVESPERLVQAGQEFEAYFISYLLKVMRETVPEGALANKQGAYFYSFYDEEIGRRAAESGGIGIARMVQEYTDKHFSSSPVKDSSSGE
ncbi:MAG: rod-binding protein [Nitrospira sp.]|nr:rod-binding protein [Nitrospira sp.]